MPAILEIQSRKEQVRRRRKDNDKHTSRECKEQMIEEHDSIKKSIN